MVNGDNGVCGADYVHISRVVRHDLIVWSSFENFLIEFTVLWSSMLLGHGQAS